MPPAGAQAHAVGDQARDADDGHLRAAREPQPHSRPGERPQGEHRLLAFSPSFFSLFSLSLSHFFFLTICHADSWHNIHCLQFLKQ